MSRRVRIVPEPWLAMPAIEPSARFNDFLDLTTEHCRDVLESLGEDILPLGALGPVVSEIPTLVRCNDPRLPNYPDADTMRQRIALPDAATFLQAHRGVLILGAPHVHPILWNDTSLATLKSALSNPHLTALDLSSQTTKPLCTLVDALTKNMHICHMELSNNYISTDGITKLAKLFETQAARPNAGLTITRLGLGHNNLRIMDARTLSKIIRCGLETLDVSSNYLCNVGLNILSGAIRTAALRHLNINANRIDHRSMDNFATTLKRNALLETLQLDHNQIGSKGAVALASVLWRPEAVMPSLKWLSVQNCSISDEGAKAFAQALQHNSVITRISLGRNQIGPEGATALALMFQNNSKIKEIELSGNSIGDVGIGKLMLALCVNTQVLICHLEMTNLTNDGVASITKMLEHNSSVSALKLSQNHIGFTGLIELIPGLLNTSLTILDLSSNIIQDGIVALEHALSQNKTLTTLDLHNNLIGNAGAKSLAQVILNNTGLKKLVLSNNRFGNAGIESIGNLLQWNETLRIIDLGFCDYDDTGLAFLRPGISKLEMLGVYYSKQFSPEARAELIARFPAGVVR